MNQISFPGLGLDFNISRAAFSVFGKPIYWYAIIIAAGFLIASYYVIHRAKELGSNEDEILDALIWAVPVAIICARLYYVIFNLSAYMDDPIRVLYIWEGGIAIYGAVIGAVITLIVFCHVRHIRLYPLLDLAALGLLIGQCIGRWGNFVNAEAYGTQTALPWRMEIFDAQTLSRIAVHPTFLYESLWNLLGFILLHIRSKHRKFSGEIFWLYVAWYGFGRSLIEGLRTDSLYFFNTGLRVSQVLGIVSFVAATIILLYYYFYKKNTDDIINLEEFEHGGTDN